ncbi:conserved hypothetical protein [Imperialibacter sp. EC-SDR9]|nr:conserved hypothetical protein [Imperialibacter sp. 75]VVT21029.1 conserved hypothetical protein [Imperialibacter sp. EC-SDR9]
MTMSVSEKARFDTRLSREQKELFEYATSLGGFRTLTEFVIHSAQQEAEKIVEKHDRIIASSKDKEIFFDALMNPPAPNKALKNALNRHRGSLKH